MQQQGVSLKTKSARDAPDNMGQKSKRETEGVQRKGQMLTVRWMAMVQQINLTTHYHVYNKRVRN